MFSSETVLVPAFLGMANHNAVAYAATMGLTAFAQYANVEIQKPANTQTTSDFFTYAASFE